MNAAYNVARWLLRDDHEARDSVQEAYLRAFRAFGTFRGGDGKPWLLTIVRNVCYAKLRKTRARESTEEFDELAHGFVDSRADDAERWRREIGVELLHQCLGELPNEAREIIVLHDIEDLTYREIATVLGVPIGTVMSRLSRARQRLQRLVRQRFTEESMHEL